MIPRMFEASMAPSGASEVVGGMVPAMREAEEAIESGREWFLRNLHSGGYEQIQMP